MFFEEYSSFQIVCCGIRAHSSLRNSRRFCNVLLRSRRTKTALLRTSQTCSIHDKSGDIAGQSILFTLFVRRKSPTKYWLSVVILENCIGGWHLAQKRQHVWRKDSVDVTLCIQVSFGEDQVCICSR